MGLVLFKVSTTSLRPTCNFKRKDLKRRHVISRETLNMNRHIANRDKAQRTGLARGGRQRTEHLLSLQGKRPRNPARKQSSFQLFLQCN